jgi:outer membrane protein assembly factor BamB
MKRLMILSAALAMIGQVRGADVPQFRGVGGRGVVREANLPDKWDDATNLRWKADLPGRGLSAPVVAKGRVFVTAASGPEQKRLHILCFDLKSGSKLWERQFWATGGTQCHPKTNMAAPTPVTDGQRVYALFATADLACVDLDGNLEWYRSLVGDYPTIGNNVGMAASPILLGENLLVHMENVGESFAVAIDRATGVNRWRIERPRLINWNTPHVIKNGAREELLLATPTSLTAHDPATGQKLWSYNATKMATMPSMTSGDGVVFAPSEGLVALAPGADGSPPKVLWHSKKLSSGYSSPTQHNGLVFTVTSKGIVNCGDAKTGELLWTQRAQGSSISASPLIVGDKLYVLAEDGPVTIFAVSREPKILGVNELKDTTFMASPIATENSLILRSDKHLYCVAEK